MGAKVESKLADACGNRNQGSIQAQHAAAVQVAGTWSKRKTLVVIIASCGAFWTIVAVIVALAF